VVTSFVESSETSRLVKEGLQKLMVFVLKEEKGKRREREREREREPKYYMTWRGKKRHRRSKSTGAAKTRRRLKEHRRRRKGSSPCYIMQSGQSSVQNNTT
jgi:hypothetical protein